MTAAVREGHSGLAAGLLGVPEDQLDPENAPTPENLTAGLHALSGRLVP